MECFRLHFDQLSWIKHQSSSGISDSRKVGSLWGMMRCVGGVIHQSWLVKGLGLGLLCCGFKVQEEIPSEKASNLPIGSVEFSPGQCTSLQLHPCHRLFDKDGHQDSSSPSLFSRPCSLWLWLFPKLRGCRYETIEERKEAVTKVIDTLTQAEFNESFQKLLERYNKCIAAERDYIEGDWSFMCVLSWEVSIRKNSGNLFNNLRIYKNYRNCSHSILRL